MTPPGAGRRLEVAGLLGDCVRLTVNGFGAMALPAFLPALASTALFWVASSEVPANLLATPATAAMLWSTLVDLALGTLVTGVLGLVALDVAVGRRHGLVAYLRQTARRFLPLLVIGVVLSVAIGIGLVFLVVPGLYVAARYLPYVPTTVFEDRGWEGIGRAEALTRGYRWPLVGALVAFGVMAGAVVLGVGVPLAGLTARLGPLPAVLLEAALTAAGYMVFAAFSAVTYLRLRLLQDGVSATEVAESIG